MGMYGAAWATVIGQIISAAIAIRYLMHYHTVTLEKQHFIPSGKVLAQICSLGMSSGINQIAMMIVQIVMNNLLKHYGAQSVYGESIPIACAGIVMKVNQLYFSIIIGLSQGSQPIESFNYGAKQYKRVKDAFLLAASVGAVVSIISFLLFQLFPRQILGLFGSGSEEYFEFGVNYFRAFLFFTWLNFCSRSPRCFSVPSEKRTRELSSPDQTDPVPAAAYRCTAAFFRHYGCTLCRTDCRPSVLCSRS